MLSVLRRWLRRPSPAQTHHVAPAPTAPWADNGEGETRRRATKDGIHLLRPLANASALESFIDSDPNALESALHGSARFGWVQHLWREGMFNGVDGDAFGDVDGVPINIISADDGRGRRVSGTVSWPHGGHRLVVGATGSNKSTAALLPLLLNDDGMNAFVIDPADGELAQNSMLYRAWLLRGSLGAAIIDPCGLMGASASINPLDVISLANPGIVRDARKLVDAVVISSGHEKDPFWVAMAKSVLLAGMLHLCTSNSVYRSGQIATLMDVQELLSKNFPDDVLEEMALNGAVDGLIQRAAVEISELKLNSSQTWHGIKAQVDASLAFLNDPGVRATLAETSFDLSQLRRGRVSVYVVLPKKEMAGMARWLRLLYASVIDRIYNIDGGRGVHVVIDEFAALGKFERVETDLATLRRFGFQFHIATQDLNQLHDLYGHGWQTIVGNCAVRQIMGVNDNFTADYVSHALGQTTRRDGFDTIKELEDGPLIKRWRWVGAPLMSPAEVLGMPKDTMLVLTDRTRPFKMRKSPFYANAPWSARAALTRRDRDAAVSWRKTYRA